MCLTLECRSKSQLVVQETILPLGEFFCFVWVFWVSFSTLILLDKWQGLCSCPLTPLSPITFHLWRKKINGNLAHLGLSVKCWHVCYMVYAHTERYHSLVQGKQTLTETKQTKPETALKQQESKLIKAEQTWVKTAWKHTWHWADTAHWRCSLPCCDGELDGRRWWQWLPRNIMCYNRSKILLMLTLYW